VCELLYESDLVLTGFDSSSGLSVYNKAYGNQQLCHLGLLFSNL